MRCAVRLSHEPFSPMSDPIKHECGLALVRLRKNLSYYQEKYGSMTYGLDLLNLLMIKQRNRGQDGAGMAVVKTDMPMGEAYLTRRRSVKKDSVAVLFEEINLSVNRLRKRRRNDGWPDEIDAKRQSPFLGELYLGHLRYGTHGQQGMSACHPYVRHNMAATRTLVLAGNFNLTNADQIFSDLIRYGLRPVGVSDTLTVLEKIGHYLDRENDRLLALLKQENPKLEGKPLADQVASRLDLPSVFRAASKGWDGGYALAGLLGHGDAFVARDPNGIRPAFYYEDDEVVAFASERPALTTVFNVEPDAIKIVEPGHLLVIRQDGSTQQSSVRAKADLHQCTFERIYFSRGNDSDIYQERKQLGRNLAARTLDLIDWDIENTVFSFIPNTAEIAFLGLVEEVDRLVRQRNAQTIWQQHEAGTLTRAALDRLISIMPRVEKSAHKDQKVRTFITRDGKRTGLISHVYDITRGSVRPTDTLVVLDDSIVRGSTLKNSIITMLSRLKPRRLIIASSAPPICYPDCYGIDMSELGRFVAFQAAVQIHKDNGNQKLLDDVYSDCQAQKEKPVGEFANHVQRIYEPIDLESLSAMIAQLIRPTDIEWTGDLEILYQTVDGLRDALPEHTGDWYFTGRYPTPGGFRVLNTAYLNFYENRAGRSYS